MKRSTQQASTSTLTTAAMIRWIIPGMLVTVKTPAPTLAVLLADRRFHPNQRHLA
ncbi:MAG: hypothetical protein AAGI28_01675 [Pseudomonadota bacterium]